MYVEEAEIAVEKKRRRGKGLASATSAALTPPITRRHSFDVGELENRLTRPKLTMFHELRAYFDPEYRLHMVKRDILKFCRELGLGVEDILQVDVEPRPRALRVRRVRGDAVLRRRRRRAADLEAHQLGQAQRAGLPQRGL